MSEQQRRAASVWSPEGDKTSRAETGIAEAEAQARVAALDELYARRERAHTANEVYLEQRRANEAARAAEEELVRDGVYVETTTVTDEQGNTHRLATKVTNDHDNRSVFARLRRAGWALHEMFWQVVLMVAVTLFGFWLLNGGWETLKGAISGLGIGI